MKASLESEDGGEGECRIEVAKLELSENDRRILDSGVSLDATLKAAGHAFRVLVMPEYSVPFHDIQGVVNASMRRQLESGQEVPIPVDDYNIPLDDGNGDPCLVAQAILKPRWVPRKELMEAILRQVQERLPWRAASRPSAS